MLLCEPADQGHGLQHFQTQGQNRDLPGSPQEHRWLPDRHIYGDPSAKNSDSRCYTSQWDGVAYLTAIQKLSGSFKGDAFDKRVLPFFIHVTFDELAKCHSGNGMIEHGWFDTLRMLSLLQQTLDLLYLKSIIKEKL